MCGYADVRMCRWIEVKGIRMVRCGANGSSTTVIARSSGDRCVGATKQSPAIEDVVIRYPGDCFGLAAHGGLGASQ